MSERFPNKALKQAYEAFDDAYNEVYWGTTTPTVEVVAAAQAAGFAAMRAVLEGHDSNVILTALLAVDELTAENAQLMTENARLRGQSRIALADMRDVLERVTNLHCMCRDFSSDECVVCSARRVLAPSTGAASDGSPR